MRNPMRPLTEIPAQAVSSSATFLHKCKTLPLSSPIVMRLSSGRQAKPGLGGEENIIAVDSPLLLSTFEEQHDGLLLTRFVPRVSWMVYAKLSTQATCSIDGIRDTH
ncbi:hypothetical protein AVEN_117135-1 [Araneus ventricosus]|uniref:Uncharacterized protein n=1 Tax=Araneus ventricosus TaxID=182803 RepID=A0A4Y2AYT1_ARAVE|nr:hypothetical protein AVEN_117135-1 [Araneus ventricosus]